MVMKNRFGNMFKVARDQPTPQRGGAMRAEGKQSEALGTVGGNLPSRVSGGPGVMNRD